MLCAKCSSATQYPDGRLRCHDGSILDRPACLAFLPGRAKIYDPEEAKRLALEEAKKAKVKKPTVETHRPVVAKIDSESEAMFDALSSAGATKAKATKKSKKSKVVSKDQMSFEL